MNCRKAEKRISRRMEGALNSVESEALNRHLAACPSCRTAESTYTMLHSEAQSLKEVAPELNIARMAVSRFYATSDSHQQKAPRIFWVAGLTASAALMVLFFFATMRVTVSPP